MPSGILGQQFVGVESAWHVLGKVRPNCISAKEAVNEGGMAYDIVKAPLAATLPDGNSVATENYALMRAPNPDDPNWAYLGVCSQDYSFWQNVEIAEMVDSLIDTTGWKFSTAGALDKGATLFICLKADSFSVRGDEVTEYFTYAETRNGKTSSNAIVSPIRVVCRNTLNVATDRASSLIPMRHHGTYKDISKFVMSMIGEAAKSRDSLREAMNALAGITVNDDLVNAMVMETVPLPTVPDILKLPKERLEGRMIETAKRAEYTYTTMVNSTNALRTQIVNRYVNSPDIPDNSPIAGTAWHCYNAVAHVTTHDMGTLGTRGGKASPESRAKADIFGDGLGMRNRAFKFLISQ